MPNGPEFPCLKYLKLSFDGTSATEHEHPVVLLSANDIFRNYLAVAKFILKQKTQLTDVTIERTFERVQFFGHTGLELAELSKPRMIEMQRCLKGLDELHLNRLAISTAASADDWCLSKYS